MNERETRITQEAEALWREVFGQPPPCRADGAAMLDAILGGLEVPGYDRLNRPHLRDASLTFPRRGQPAAGPRG